MVDYQPKCQNRPYGNQFNGGTQSSNRNVRCMQIISEFGIKYSQGKIKSMAYLLDITVTHSWWLERRDSAV